MLIHALYTQPNFWRHIRPIFNLLPPSVKGQQLDGSKDAMVGVAPEDVILVAGYGNIAQAGWRRVIYIEHGAGQSYKGARASSRPHYPGGHHPANVIGYVCPNETVAAAWRRPAVVVGCPAVDNLHLNGFGTRVVFTFHWDGAAVAPEARSAKPHYLDHLHEMALWARQTHNREPLGHWHPRDRYGEAVWKMIGVETEPDPDEALKQAALVVADNTSFAYEAAHCGIANVALNAPWYRRDVEHGLRFWSYPPGHMVDDAYELMSRSAESWVFDGTNRKIGRAAAERAYGVRRGSGGARLAVEFILDLLS